MLEIRAGISAEIWDINGPHLFHLQAEGGEILRCGAVTGEKGIAVETAQCETAGFSGEESCETGPEGAFRVWRRTVRQGEALTLDLFSAVYTSLDGEDPKGAARGGPEGGRRGGMPGGGTERL